MAVINIYEQYFEAYGSYNGTDRHAALVMLIADSEQGNICYKAAITLFPHNDPEDFAVSYDAFFEEILYDAKGRRSKKREKTMLDQLQDTIGQLAEKNGAVIYFDRPLREARLG
jgi:hypothetical protein